MGEKRKNEIARIILFCIALILLVTPAMAAASTQVHVVKYAIDGTTILNETTVDYHWMELNLPIYGNGVTHYYMQGPVFNSTITDKWNPEENDPAILTKDFGAAKGTNIKDLCELAGGMSSADYNVTLLASDGFSKSFAYSSIYNPPARSGPNVLTWYRADQGYVDGLYATGMRNVIFADTTTNPWAAHVFGLWDMHETIPESFWYYYQPGQPSATGLSVQNIDRVLIYSKSPVPPDTGNISVTSDPVGAEIFINSIDSTYTTPHTFSDKVVGSYDVYVTKNGYVTPNAQTKSVTKGATTSFSFALSQVPPDTGSISVISDPAGAEIFINSVDTTFATPHTFTNKVVGSYDVYVTKNGYVTPNAQTKSVTKGATTSFSFALSQVPPDTGSISVISDPAGAEIFINSVDTTFATPHTFTNKVVGSYDVYVTKSGYVTPITQTKSVTKGATTSFSFTLSAVPPDTGSIEVSSNPTGAEIFINSVDTTFATPHTFADKVVGSYDVYVTKNGYVTPITQTKSVTKGATTSFSFTLSQVPPDTGSIEVSSNPSGAEIFINSVDTTFATPHTFADKVVGSYDVYVTKSGYVTPGTQTKSVTKGATTSFSLALSQVPAVDTIFDGVMPLTQGETFTKQAYNNLTGGLYTINRTTPLGALDSVATMNGLTVNVTDKRWSNDQDLLLDDIGKYLNKKPNAWYVYINGVPKDGYGNHANGLDVIELANNDQVNFYYAPSKDPNPVVNASAVIRIKANIQAPVPAVDTIFDGVISLTQGETFTKQAYNNLTGGLYTVNRTTPFGALDSVGTMKGLTINVTDKRWSYDQDLLLDDIGKYLNKKPNTWYVYVNGVPKDGYGNHANGLDVIELANNDQVNFYYAPSKDPNPVVNATAVVKIKANIPTSPGVDTIFDGTVTLTPGETFAKQAYNNLTGGLYTINRTTPLGALDKVATSLGLTVNVTDKRWSYDQDLLLDDIGKYLNKKPNTWYIYVNGVPRDGYGNHANGINVIELANNDQVNFYYAPSKDPNPVVNATAAVKIKANIGGQPPAPDWTLSLSGAKNSTITKTLFEEGLACTSSGHQVFWNDTDGNTWGGVPLWLLVGMVDDNPDVGPDHFNFNDSIASQGYSVKVISGDGWDTTLASKDIARNNSYIVANTLNGQPLSFLTPGGKRSWPLHLKGAAVFGGQQVGNITRIELSGLPQPATEWKLILEGDVADTITQSYFIEAIASHHNVTWTDTSNNVWEGIALWDLAGAVDDIETSNHFTFNDTRAAANYTIRVAASDFSADFYSKVAAHSNGYILAYKKNGAPLTGASAPLQLVGSLTTSGKQRVGNVSKISLIGLPDQFPAGSWSLKLNGKIGDIIPQSEFEYSADCHGATFTDTGGNVYTGIPLWRLLGWVDDRIPHGSDGFNDAEAIAGYNVVVKAGDGYAKTFTSKQIGKNNDFIVANTMNGAPLSIAGDHPPYPLRLVGNGATGGNSVGNIAEIQLTDFQTPTEAPKLHVMKYGTDGVTVINETYIDYYYMESSMPVIGDGTTAYKFEGLTLNASNLWDPEETYPGGYKISNIVKGTRVRDLAELVGGMDSGTTITFVASDNFETTLPYSSIYTNPAVQARQGDAFIAWWGDGQYVPAYADGMRLFFTAGNNHVYSHWDMHETLPSQYYRYNFQNGVQYPSAAGLSAKFITTIKVYSSPETDWTLQLDGRDVGGLAYNVSKPFLEEALGCQFGSEHKASYTDSKGRVWEGMPLWFFAGFVDDADQHSANAYNETKALAGYNIIVTGKDGYSATIPGKDIIRSSNYLVANSLNGSHIDEAEENWPLRLTGANVNGGMTVKGVTSIKLVKIAKPMANFTATPGSGIVPLTVQFSNNSTGLLTSLSWDFGDGSTSTEQNPMHQYTTAGNFTVNLTITGPGGSDTAIKPGYINVGAHTAPKAKFSGTPVSGTSPLNVVFSDESTGFISSYKWDFGDGNTSTLQTPSHMYAKAGKYTVKLIVSNAAGNNTETKKNYITVKTPVPFIAAFTARPTTGTAPLRVAFSDASTGPIASYAWNFGDGSVSTLRNPVHTFTKIGSYIVTLTVANGDGSASKNMTITVKPKEPVARFDQSKHTGRIPLTVAFTDKSLNGPTSYLWRFGDGGTSTQKSPTHTYTKPGVYFVQLTATNSGGSDSATSLVFALPKWWFW